MQQPDLKQHGIYIQENELRDFIQSLPLYDNTFVITDSNISGIYPDFFPNMIIIPPGEKSKNLSVLENIYDELLQREADRDSLILGFGGGVVTDIAGFTANTYMRGTHSGFIPTSLLAMIDASIGGKNGINYKGYKNIIGTINQPGFIAVNPRFLNTLPEDEFKNGMAEAIKHFLIADRDGFYEYKNNINKYRDRNFIDKEFLEHQIKIKLSIVLKDVREHGERRKLNFGHTFGHAIEKLSGIKHGFAVSTGMVIAAKISAEMGLLSAKEVENIKSALSSTGLPVETDLDAAALLDTIRKDKKKSGEEIYFVALNGAGKAQIVKLPFARLEKLLFKVKK